MIWERRDLIEVPCVKKTHGRRRRGGSGGPNPEREKGGSGSPKWRRGGSGGPERRREIYGVKLELCCNHLHSITCFVGACMHGVYLEKRVEAKAQRENSKPLCYIYSTVMRP